MNAWIELHQDTIVLSVGAVITVVLTAVYVIPYLAGAFKF